MTKQEYLQALRQRKDDLKIKLMLDRHDNIFVEPSDKRYREFQLLKRVLRLHKG